MTARYRIQKYRHPVRGPIGPWLVMQKPFDPAEQGWQVVRTAPTQQGALAQLVSSWRALDFTHLCGGGCGREWECQACDEIVDRWWQDLTRRAVPELAAYLGVACPGHQHRIPIWTGPDGYHYAQAGSDDIARCAKIGSAIDAFNQHVTRPDGRLAELLLAAANPAATVCRPVTVPDGVTITCWTEDR